MQREVMRGEGRGRVRQAAHGSPIWPTAELLTRKAPAAYTNTVGGEGRGGERWREREMERERER